MMGSIRAGFLCGLLLGMVPRAQTLPPLVKTSEAIKPLEPVLLPTGTFIAMSVIDPSLGNAEDDLAHLANEAMAEIMAGGQEPGRKKRDTPEIPKIQTLAGIRPLSIINVPMGIFISDEAAGVSSPSTTGNPQSTAEPTAPAISGPTVPSAAGTTAPITPGSTAAPAVIPPAPAPNTKAAKKRKISAGIRRIFRLLSKTKAATLSGTKQMSFAETFRGITPLQAVYIPKGILIPLSRIPGLPDSHPVLSTVQSFGGISPLSVVKIPAGVFIPHNVSSLPPLPSPVMPGPIEPEACGPEDPNCATSIPSDPGSEIPAGTDPTTASSAAAAGKLTPEELELLFKKWMEAEYETAAEKFVSQQVQTAWNFETNISDANENALIVETTQIARFRAWVAQALPVFHPPFSDPQLQRLHRKMSDAGEAILNGTKHEILEKLKADMKRTHSMAKVCGDSGFPVEQLDNCPVGTTWDLSPRITRTMSSSRNSSLLLHIWKSWRDATSTNKEKFVRYVQLKNEAARLHKYTSNGQFWREPYVEYESKYSDVQFMKDVKKLFMDVFPLYKELHAYIRRKLMEQYPEAKIQKNGPIPAHLLGHINSYNWRSLYDFTQPYPRTGKEKIDVSAEMKNKGWTTEKMFKNAESFFTGLGLAPLPGSFWKDSMFTKPADRHVMCQASSFDFKNRHDFRLRMCADITFQDFLTAHEEMGKMEYALAYVDQPFPFRDGANAGFVEAVGNAISLSVATPAHLKKLSLLNEEQAAEVDKELNHINFLFSVALEKIAFLPYALLVDKYRFDVFEERVPSEQLNSAWWRDIVQYQGVCSPVVRNEQNFDPAALYQMNADVPYMQKFVSLILQFQFHEALCDASGYTGLLSKCDIDGSKVAGQKLKDMMSLGSSVPWQDALQKLTGTTQLKSEALLEFFEPLYEWLERDNVQHNVPVGWRETPNCI